MTMKIDNFEAFAAMHPLRIDLSGGDHLRFNDVRCAARSAMSRRLQVWDESQGHAITLAECKMLIDRYEPSFL